MMNLYRHKRHNKDIPSEMTLDAFIKRYGPIPDDKILLMVKGTLKWMDKADTKGLSKKAKGTRSPYLGTVFKRTKSGREYYYANFKGKYVAGSVCDTDEEAAALRDNYIISLGLQDKFTLNFQ